MRKLVDGILHFKREVRPQYAHVFEDLATGQAPAALFICCADSRVVPNLLSGAYPGELFVDRNAGNIIAPGHPDTGESHSDESEAASLEYAIQYLHVPDVVVMGHSNCGAMKALYDGRNVPGAPNLVAWLRHGEGAMTKLREKGGMDPTLPPVDQLSQWNVLEQLDHVRTYPCVSNALKKGTVRLHAWWFDVAEANIHVFDKDEGRYLLLTPEYAETMLQKMGL